MIYIIKEPIWNGGKRCIGVAMFRIKGSLDIQIDYKDKMGNKVYPFTYRVTKDQAMNYPEKTVRGGTVLRIIPIEDLEVVE